jgi:outer membrane phospholipase A
MKELRLGSKFKEIRKDKTTLQETIQIRTDWANINQAVAGVALYRKVEKKIIRQCLATYHFKHKASWAELKANLKLNKQREELKIQISKLLNDSDWLEFARTTNELWQINK